MDNVLKIRRIDWFDDLFEQMSESLKGDGELLKQEVLDGTAQLWQLGQLTYMITREEYIDGKRILVVCAYEGRDIVKASKALIIQCIRQGYHAIRYHTSRAGMIKLGKQLGFTVYEVREHETVMHKILMRIN